MNLRCWWFGCHPHPWDPAPFEELTCFECGENLDYEALAGISRWNSCKDFMRYWLWRRWVPERCTDCGRRYGPHDGCLPF